MFEAGAYYHPPAAGGLNGTAPGPGRALEPGGTCGGVLAIYS
jgi:hypothetical protein